MLKIVLFIVCHAPKYKINDTTTFSLRKTKFAKEKNCNVSDWSLEIRVLHREMEHTREAIGKCHML